VAGEMTGPSRRTVLAGAGASLGTLGLAGCLGSRFPNTGGGPDRTAYVGAYHWGFVLLDEEGREHEAVTLDPGTRLRLVAFNAEAHEAIEALPASIQEAMPDHETLERRNEVRIPEPPSGTMHDALAAANERYPDHSLAVMPSGYNEMPMGGYGMGDGMDGPMGGGGSGGRMLHPVPLPHDASQPAVAGLVASDRGDYTLSCLTYCGYGHPFMELDGAFVVR